MERSFREGHIFTTLGLAALLHACAPRVGPRTLTAIIRVESGGNPHALHDNTSGRTYHPISAFRAARVARALVAAGHSVDLGLGQINSMNLPGLGLSVDDMFDPCTNIEVGSQILAQDYRRATRRFGPGQLALRHAIGAYNTGSIFAGRTYISLVLAAGHVQPDRQIALASTFEPHATHRHHRERSLHRHHKAAHLYVRRPRIERLMTSWRISEVPS